MNEAEAKGLRGDLARVDARIKLFEAIQQDQTDLSEVTDHYLKHAEDICLEHDYTIAVKRAQVKGFKVPTREEAFRTEVLRRYHLDLRVGIRFKAEDPTILGPIKTLPDLIKVERNERSDFRLQLNRVED